MAWIDYYLNATVVINFIPGESQDKQTFAKYHNIRNVKWKIEKFEKFVKKKYPAAHHINYYAAKSPHEFKFRNYLQNQK